MKVRHHATVVTAGGFVTGQARQLAAEQPEAAAVIAGFVASIAEPTVEQVAVLRRALPPVEAEHLAGAA